MSGMMVGIDEACKWLSEKTLKAEDMPNRIINRLRYVQAKDKGIKPKYHKGKYIKDWWTCGNCGVTLHDGVRDNYCWNCGYRILWDSTRCLTGTEETTKQLNKQLKN